RGGRLVGDCEMRCFNPRAPLFAGLECGCENAGGEQGPFGRPGWSPLLEHLLDSLQEKSEMPERSRLLGPEDSCLLIGAACFTPGDDPFAIRRTEIAQEHRTEPIQVFDEERGRFKGVTEFSFRSILRLASIRRRGKDIEIEATGFARLPHGLTLHVLNG